MDSNRIEVKTIMSNHTDWVRTVCFSPDQTKLCSGGDDKKVILTNLQNNQTEKVFTGSSGLIYGSDFSKNGEFLATGSDDSSVVIWNVTESENGNNSTKLESHAHEVFCVRYFPNDPNHVISGSGDSTIKIWNVERKEVISTLEQDGNIYDVDILPDQQTLVNGDFEMLRIWDLRSGKCVQTLDQLNIHGDVFTVQYNPGHNSFSSLAFGGEDKNINIVDFRTFKLLQSYQEHSDSVSSISYHPSSGEYLLSGSYDGSIKIFSLSEKKIIFSSKDHEKYHNSQVIEYVQFSPDGKLFAYTGWDEKVFLWNFPLGRRMVRDEDIDEEERIKYLIQQDLLLCEFDEENDFREQNVLKIRIDNFCTLFCYRFFCVIGKKC